MAETPTVQGALKATVNSAIHFFIIAIAARIGWEIGGVIWRLIP